MLSPTRESDAEYEARMIQAQSAIMECVLSSFDDRLRQGGLISLTECEFQMLRSTADATSDKAEKLLTILRGDDAAQTGGL